MLDGTSLNYNGGGGGALSASFSDSVTTGDIIDFQLQHLHTTTVFILLIIIS